MKYFVYLLRCSDETLYCGVTTDVDRRLEEHNTSSKGAKYTKGRRPVVLVYHEECEDKSSALKRELAIKRLSREQKEALVDIAQFGMS